MSDYPHCEGLDCPLRETCERHVRGRKDIPWYEPRMVTLGRSGDVACYGYIHDEGPQDAGGKE